MTIKLTLSLILTMGLLASTLTAQNSKAPSDTDLAKKIARFAPTTLTADVSKLTPKDRQALDKIIAAAKLLDPLFLRQVWSGNDALEKKLLADKSPLGRERLHYFYINDGPWSRLDNNDPFIAGGRAAHTARVGAAHLCFCVADVLAAHRELTEAGVRFFSEPHQDEFGVRWVY